MSKSKVLFFMTGSIAAFKACQLLSTLVKDGHEVQVVATPSTFNFIGRSTLEGLSGKKVLNDLWENGHAMDHIRLSRWADFGIVCPASANTIAKLAGGFADDLMSALILAWPNEKPLTIVPAMNSLMFSAKPTQDNISKLKERNFTVTETQSGSLACGDEGAGRMLEVEQILNLLTSPPRTLGKILITSGASREYIDGIRFISNVSTGQTAATLADELIARRWQVTYLHGQGAQLPKLNCTKQSYMDFKDLNERLRATLSSNSYSGAIHCAAVSDYSIENANPEHKLSSDLDLQIQLKRNFKILPLLKEYSKNKDIQIAGFKLTFNSSSENILLEARKALGQTVDAIVANDWSDVNKDRSRHPGVILKSDGELTNFNTLPELASQLHEMFKHKELAHDSLS